MAILQCSFSPTFYYFYLRTLTGKSCTIISFPPCKPLNISRTPHYFIENLKVQENKLKKFFFTFAECLRVYGFLFIHPSIVVKILVMIFEQTFGGENFSLPNWVINNNFLAQQLSSREKRSKWILALRID